MRANFSNLDNSSLAVTKALSPIIGIVTLRDGTLGVPEVAEMVVVGWGTRGCGEADVVTNTIIIEYKFLPAMGAIVLPSRQINYFFYKKVKRIELF